MFRMGCAAAGAVCAAVAAACWAWAAAPVSVAARAATAKSGRKKRGIIMMDFPLLNEKGVQ